MKYLNKYTPAEITLITEKNSAPFEETIKFTFLDLILKDVLQMTYVKKDSKSDSKQRYFRYVVTGPNFNTYDYKIHEKIILQPFFKAPDIRILFQHMLKMIFEKAETKKKYFGMILEGREMRHFTTKNVFHYFFGGFKLDKDGKKAYEEIVKEIAEAKYDLENALKYNVDKATRLIKEMRGNIFLLKIDPALFKNKELLVLQDINKYFIRVESGEGSGCYGCSYFIGGYGGCSGGSGCSSTGCNGCSGGGCSGCGGCN